MVLALTGAAALVTLVLLLAHANRDRDHALALQSRSYEVVIVARMLSGTIERAEATLGRYVISGEKDVGRVYYDQWKQAGTLLVRLDRATRDNPPQRRLVERLHRVYDARGAELSATALRTTYGQNPQALRRYYDVGKSPVIGQIDAVLDEIIAHERGLLDQRTSAARTSADWTRTVTQVLSGMGILIAFGAVMLGWSNVQAMAQRARARRDAEAAAERAAELEQAVVAATAEVRSAYDQLQEESRERAVAEAQVRQMQKMEAVGQLTGGIAHDFNNMLAVVIGGLELARRRLHEDPGHADRHIAAAMEGANRAAELTRRLLAFSRAEPLLPEAARPIDLIRGMHSLLERTLGERIRVDVVEAGDDWRVWIDRHQLENAILNLAVNARDAMDGAGLLTIRCGQAVLSDQEVNEAAGGEYATIAVADSGCGMTPEVLEHVFEPFFTTKPVGKGTGLGLSQIFGFVRQSGGEIEIASTPGRGTTVTVYLPRHAAALSTEPIGEPVPIVEDGGSPAPHDRLRVLVVEDDPRVLAATTGALEELGHDVVTCGDPLAAPRLLETDSRFDLIITDVMMPGQTGPELIARLRPLHPDIAVLFVTGYAGDVADAGMFGGQAVLRKPFTLASLERAVDEALLARDAIHSLAAE